ncbi:Pycsar system effector family protein [Streptomyces sp. NPDC046939]|uniref:Pycsar system effector family protein n=1 Tax=Streptomyces sp. NPDC046939 TaxID=3155376 RepID=UPI0034103B22
MSTPRGGDGTVPDADVTTDHGAELARVLLAEAREEVVRADNKAALMLAFLAGAATAVLAAIGSGDIAVRHYGMVPLLFLWAGGAACATALVLLGLAVTPRLGSPYGGRTHYFGDTRLAVTAGHLERCLRHTDLAFRNLSQLTVMSRIAWTKYRCIRLALIWGGASVALALTGVAAGTLT